jgi:hypothetical protein
MGKKKKKRRESKRFERASAVERGLTKASHRIARAVSIGVDTWARKRSRSANKKRDGAIRDALINSTFATTRMLREVSWAPSDYYAATGRKRDPRRVVIRALLPLWR